MNAREAMQALLDGKIVVTDGHARYVLNDKGYIGLDHGLIREEPCGSFLNSVVEVIEEYPLTFEQALREMLDGKVVMCKEPSHGYAYRFHNGRFEDSHVNDCFTRWEQCGMPTHRQNGKWKVVE